MPIPILLGLGVVAGVTGVAKAVGAKQKNDEAKDVSRKPSIFTITPNRMPIRHVKRQMKPSKT